MKLPNGDRAVVPIEKLRDYSLDPHHAEGKHKARVFASALGLGQDDAEWLRDQLLAAAPDQPCELGRRTPHGQRYVMDLTIKHRGKSAIVRSVWNVRSEQDSPRLVTCHVL